jgi:hypothetical protein
MNKKIKVLFLAADPFRDGAQLDLDEEMSAIERALDGGKAGESLELTSHFATRTSDLQTALLNYEPQIVHFAGHGGKAGSIYLDDGKGEPTPVGKAALRKLFSALDGGVRVVFLNGCHTHSIVDALRDVVDYAIGTNRVITDEGAIDFAQAFYGALASGRDVKKAFKLAVNRLELDGSDEATVPVLRTRFGADREPLIPTAEPTRGTRAGGGQTNRIGRINARNDVTFHDQNGQGSARQTNHVADLSARDVRFIDG